VFNILLYPNCLSYVDNMISCTLGMLSCDIFYAGSKIVIYAWLIERIHLVTAVKTSRLRTCRYRFHLVLLCPYIVILVLMVCIYPAIIYSNFANYLTQLTYRNIYLESDGKCTIGLQLIASVPLLVYDFVSIHSSKIFIMHRSFLTITLNRFLIFI
jgi:hypothetical protein